MRGLESASVTILALGLATQVAGAQRRPAPTTATKSSASAAQAGAAASGAKTKFTLFGGIATGDGYDLGFAVQGSFRLEQPGWPVAIRIDPYVARHSGDFGYGLGNTDVSLTMLGVAGNAEYTFKTSGSQVEPYILGGVGIYHGSVDISNNASGFNAGGADTNLGLGVGGGIRFAKRWAAEAHFKTINSFDTIPILLGFHF